MGTDVYVVDSREMKPWYELLPNKIKKVLENPGPRDRLLVCVAEDICGADNGEREFFNNISGVEYTSSCDFNPKDYDELSLSEPEKFITACHDGTLLDSASNPLEYKVLRSWYQNILSLQGLGYLCGYSGKAEKILNMLKPYLDAVYDLPLPVKEDSDNE